MDVRSIEEVAPVIEQLARRGVGPVSVDTRKGAVARAARAAGAAVVNDVSGLAFDPALAVVPRAGLIHRLDKDTSGLVVVAKNAIPPLVSSDSFT